MMDKALLGGMAILGCLLIVAVVVFIYEYLWEMFDDQT